MHLVKLAAAIDSSNACHPKTHPLFYLAFPIVFMHVRLESPDKTISFQGCIYHCSNQGNCLGHPLLTSLIIQLHVIAQ